MGKSHLGLNDLSGVANAYDTIGASLSDPNLDAITRGELAQGYAQITATKGTWGVNDPTSTINSLIDTIDNARNGVGVYGVRKINENQKNLISAQPGRAQLTAAKLGAARQGGNGPGPANGQAGGLGANGSPLGNFF